MTGGPSIVFNRKAIVDKPIFETQKAFANQLWVYTPVNFTPSQCVKKCPLGFTLDGSLIQTLRSLKLDKINRGNLRTWLCRTYNFSVLTALLKATTQLELRKRLIVSM